MRLVLLSLTFVVLSGCSRQSEQPEPAANAPRQPSAAQPAPPEDNRPLIVAFGDSLSEGYGAAPGQSYPDHLQRELDAAGYRYRVVNLGVSGDTTTGGLNRISAAVSLRPQLVILELGGNDGLRGVPISSTRANLEQMVVALKDAKIETVLAGMSLPPNYGSEYIRSFEAMYKDLARKYKLTLIPFLLEDIARQIGQSPGLIQRDGIHPTAEGNKLVAKGVMKIIAPLLEK